jgi:hypothetical protein
MPVQTPSGLSCAFGCFVSESEYTVHFEGNTASGVIGDYEDTNPLIPKTGQLVIEFCTELQRIHDRFDECDWPAKLSALADEYSLTMPEMEAAI